MANPQKNSLSGIVVAEVKDNEIKKITTAETATVHFNPHHRFNEVQITAYNPYQMGSEAEGTFSAQQLSLTMEFGSLLSDDIKFKKIDEMKRIRLDPIRFYPVAKAARQLYAQLTTELLAEDITDKINHNTNSFYKLHSSQKIIEFTAERCTVGDEKKVQLSEDIVVIESDAVGGQPLRTLRCAKALLHITGDEFAPTLTMELYNAAWQALDGSEGLTQRHIIRGLILPETVTDKFATPDILKAVTTSSIDAALKKEPTPRLTALQQNLQRKIQKTLDEIKAEMHSRLVFGIGCITTIMIGIAAGIILKGGHLLSAFGASSIPAALLIVCIMMGKNITKNPTAQAGSGPVLMWAGLVFLSLSAVIIYNKLLKN